MLLAEHLRNLLIFAGIFVKMEVRRWYILD